MHSRVSDVSSSHANLLEQKKVITQEHMTTVSLTVFEHKYGCHAHALHIGVYIWEKVEKIPACTPNVV